MRLLLVEPRPARASALARALHEAGHTLERLTPAACATRDMAAYALVILDLDTSTTGDRSTCQAILRQAQQAATPVLAMTRQGKVAERVALLDMGADDCLAKTVAASELQARVRALVRRQQHGPRNEEILVGPLRLDLIGKRAWCRNVPVTLIAREWALLALFASQPYQVVSQKTVAQALQRDAAGITANSLAQIIARFRRRLAASGMRLRTVRGVGYYFEVERRTEVERRAAPRTERGS